MLKYTTSLICSVHKNNVTIHSFYLLHTDQQREKKVKSTYSQELACSCRLFSKHRGEVFSGFEPPQLLFM